MQAPLPPPGGPAPTPTSIDPLRIIGDSLRFLRNEALPLALLLLPLLVWEEWQTMAIEQAWLGTMEQMAAQPTATDASGDASSAAGTGSNPIQPRMTQAQADALGATVGPAFLQLLFADSLLLAGALAYLRLRSSGAPAGWLASARFALVLLPAVLLVRMIGAVAVFGGALAFLLPGLLLWVRLSLALPVLAITRCSPLQALGRSVQLTDGRFWPLLTVMAAIVCSLWAVTQLINVQHMTGTLSDGVALFLRTLLNGLDLVYVVALFRITMLLLPADPPDST